MREAIGKSAPVLAGLVAAPALIGLYLGLVTWAQGFDHAREGIAAAGGEHPTCDAARASTAACGKRIRARPACS